MWKNEKLPPAWIDSLLIYTMVGTVVGARLGHCLFYDPGYYLANPIEIFKADWRAMAVRWVSSSRSIFIPGVSRIKACFGHSINWLFRPDWWQL